MTDTINDLFIPDGEPSPRQLDARSFFQSSEVKVVSHNAGHIFHDMRTGEAQSIDLSFKPVLRIQKSKALKLEDLFDPRKYRPGFFSFVRRHRTIRPNPLSITKELPRPPFNSLDVRDSVPATIAKLHADIYSFPPPIPRRIKRYLRRNRKRIATWTGILASLAISIILLSLSAKTYIEHETIRSYNRISALKDIRDMGALSNEVESIQTSFERVSLVFSPFRFALDNRFYSHPSVHLAGNVIQWWLSLSDSLEQALAIAEELEHELPRNASGAIDVESFSKSSLKITDFLKSHKGEIENINDHLASTLASYAGIESLGNPVLDEKLKKNLQTLLGVKEILSFTLDNFDNVLRMLGDSKPERYLILNQNRDELRANGGFPWSILAFELYKGRVQKFEKHDVYDYDWKLYPYKETPPEGLQGYIDNFGIRDANYYPDFDDSAKKIGFFVEKAGYSSVDTMIAINQGIIIDFLKKYGPIKLPEYNLTIDAANFSRVVSTLVEARVFPYKKLDTGHSYQSPKEFLFRFMEAFSKNLAEKRDIFGYLSIISEHFKSHEILAYSNSTDTEKFLENLWARESWKEDQGNWIYPIFTSLSANKSDRYMNRKLTTNSTMSMTGCIVHTTVNMYSDHAISVDETIKTRKLLYDFGINDAKEQEKLVFIEWNGANKQYIRFLVPKGSLLDPGSDMKAEPGTDNYAVFSAFWRTEPRKSSTLKFGYTSKIPNCIPRMNFYEQPGMVNMKTSGE